MPAISLPGIGNLMNLNTGGQFAAAAAAVLGGLIALGNWFVGGALMLIAAVGMVLTFGAQSAAAIAIILSALGAAPAIFNHRPPAANAKKRLCTDIGQRQLCPRMIQCRPRCHSRSVQSEWMGRNTGKLAILIAEILSVDAEQTFIALRPYRAHPQWDAGPQLHLLISPHRLRHPSPLRGRRTASRPFT